MSHPANPVDSIRSGIPAFLEGPATSRIQPPVETLAQTLPCEQLTWENFERLCVRMARLDSDIEQSRLYGVRGQAQEGIDLFARSFNGEYAVYQCKRVESLTAGDIRTAVEKFLDGSWAPRASKFVLCTSHAAARTEQAEEYSKQFELLKQRNVRFAIWDREEISSILRDQPRLVHDFFGKAWLTAFLGKTAARAFQSRLEPEKVGEFRLKLRQFYETIFARQDPGIPIPPRPGLQSIPLAQRFIPQDILVDERRSSAVASRDKQPDQLGQEAPQEGSKQNQEKNKASQLFSTAAYRTRESISTWLARTPNSVITGGPGSGKSALLRYLALEILADQPPADRVAKSWTERLPVWLPFAFWTKQIVDGGQCNVTEAARRWLDSWNQADLWTLVEDALEDERLLLLVDGVDESANDEAARVALQMLQVYVQTKKVCALVTSRPLFSLAVQGAEWQAGEIAGLSGVQKARLSTQWFELRNQVEAQFGNATATPEFLAQETQSFLRDLAESPDLEQLSRVPLLLLLLLYLRFQNAILPRDRFDAYSKLVDYLAREHPASRRVASQATSSRFPLRDKELQNTLAQIALHVQLSAPEGIISSDELTHLTEDILNDPSGLDLKLAPAELRDYADGFVRRVQDASGILVRQGVDAVSFLHHSLQEHLAATQIASMAMPQIIKTIESHLLDSRWREVVLNVLWNLQRPAEVGQLIERIEAFVASGHSGLYVRELLTEVACSAIECPSDLARNIATEAVRLVENHEWLPHRRRLVRYLVSGLNGAKTKDIAKRAMARWVFRSGDWRAYWYEPFAGWSARSDVIEALILSLNDEDTNVQRAAAESLAQIAGGNQDWGNVIADLVRTTLDPTRGAAALRALSLGWKGHPSLWQLISDGMRSRSPELQLTAVCAKVRLGRRDDLDWKILMAYATADIWARDPWGWTGEIVSSLAIGWQGSPGLKKLCLEAEQARFGNRKHLDWEIAQRVLLEAFPQDEDVAKYCADQIKTQSLPFTMIHFDAWKLLAKSFCNNPIVAAAIDEWAPKQTAHEPELRYAAMVGRTPILKRKLVESIGSSSVPFWAAGALLEGWGLDDPEVAAALTDIAYGQPARASGIAQFIPQIIDDPRKARERLMQLLPDPQARFPHLTLRGLASLKDRGDEEEIVQQALTMRESRFIRSEESFDSELILAFSTHPEIRAFGRRLLEGKNPPVNALAKSFEHDEEIRQRLLEIIVCVPASLRSEVIDGIARVTTDPELALTNLERYDTESNADLKVLGSTSFHGLLVRHQRDTTSAVAALSEAIRAYGFDHDARRQAALAGILVLKRWDLMNQSETIGTSRPISVPLESHGQLNLSLLRLVAEHWHELRAAFGDTLRDRISHQFSVTPLQEALALVAAEFPELQDEVWNAADQNIIHSTNVLRLLATVKPRSELLKVRCLNIIRRDDGTWGGIERVNSAAAVLGENFSNIEEVKTEIIQGRSAVQLSEGEILALCAGWPNDPVISRLHELFRKHQHTRLSLFGTLSVFYASVGVEQFVEILFQHLDVPRICNSRAYESLKGPVERRVRRDREVRLALHEALRTNATSSGKASIPRLLARAEGLTTELHEWVRQELARQLSRNSIPETGFDLIEGSARSVASCLLDTLES